MVAKSETRRLMRGVFGEAVSEEEAGRWGRGVFRCLREEGVGWVGVLGGRLRGVGGFLAPMLGVASLVWCGYDCLGRREVQ